MRILPILTAAAIGVVASYGLANAQATNTAPQSGTAKTLSGTGSDTMANQKAMTNQGQKAMAKGKKAKKSSQKRM